MPTAGAVAMILFSRRPDRQIKINCDFFDFGRQHSHGVAATDYLLGKPGWAEFYSAFAYLKMDTESITKSDK